MKKTAFKWFVLSTAFTAFGAYASAQDVDTAKFEYRTSCAACHGMDGKGGGPVSSELKSRPTDLTLLAKKNNGEFPTSLLSEVIDGTRQDRAHGNREMPVWGLRYVMNPEMARTFLNLPYAPRTAIIEYLNRIQEK
jgi:mono/diheme cytochrome c family protein